jgi:folate-binding protein YgfZ
MTDTNAMNADWQTWLTARDALFQNGQLLHFGRPDAERDAVLHGSVLTDLGHYGLLQAEGADAAEFLQNQFGNDVRKVNNEQSQLNSYCSPKGRVYSVFRLFQADGRYLLRMPAGLIPALHKRLQMFVLRSKVELVDIGATQVRIGVSGTAAEQVLRTQVTLPAAINGAAHSKDITVLKVPGTARYELYGPLQALRSVWQALSSIATPAGHDAWPLLDILNGIPTVYPETSEHFVPQMLNLQLVEGLSFKKGCYPGQEVVARMQYRGTLKRRMHLFTFKSPTLPAPGADIVAIGADGTPHAAGEIVDARFSTGQQGSALAVVQLANLEQALHVGTADGPRLEPADLPYAYDQAATA